MSNDYLTPMTSLRHIRLAIAVRRVFTFFSALIIVFGFTGRLYADMPEENEQNTPADTIRQTTEQVLKVIQKHRVTFKKNPNAFFSDVEKIMNPVIAFDQFARGVMGKYAHRATDEQRQAFVNTFKNSLITFYGKAVMTFDTGGISFDPVQAVSKESIERYQQRKSRSVPVEMKLRSNNREYGISYSLIQISGNWKVRNIVVEGVNIGIQFRNQFSEAIKEYKTIDGVIASWSTIMRSQFKSEGGA